MAKSSLFAFCLPDELSQWLRALCLHHSLDGLTFGGSERGVVSPGGSITITTGVYRLFLFPRNRTPLDLPSMNEVKARRWGWVDIRPGSIRAESETTILTLTEIHGEDFDDEDVHPARFVRWLKRYLRDVLLAGVVGRNLITDALAEYHDIHYSRAALDFFRERGVWKQDSVARIVFFPRDGAPKEPQMR